VVKVLISTILLFIKEFSLRVLIKTTVKRAYGRYCLPRSFADFPFDVAGWEISLK